MPFLIAKIFKYFYNFIMINIEDIKNEQTEILDRNLEDLNDKLDCIKAMMRHLQLPEKTIEDNSYMFLNPETNEYEKKESYWVKYVPSRTNFQENSRIIRSYLMDICKELDKMDFYVGSIKKDSSYI